MRVSTGKGKQHDKGLLIGTYFVFSAASVLSQARVFIGKGLKRDVSLPKNSLAQFRV